MNNAKEQDVRLYGYQDEISLFDIYRVLVKRRLVILLIFTATVLGAVLYLAMVQPVYEAKIRLLLPKATTTFLTVPPHPYGSFDPATVFDEFQAQLKLMEQWSAFVVSNPEWFGEQSGNEPSLIFGENPIELSQDRNFPAKHVDVTYQHHSRSSSAEILQNYFNVARENYVTGLLALVKDKVEQEKAAIEFDIVMLRKRAEFSRKDEIERLRQDLMLARVLGITDNLLVRSSEASRLGSDIAIIAANETVRSYMRGTNVLEAELDALLNRESNDPYIDGLRENQIELTRLESLRVSAENFMPYVQDGEIVSSSAPVKPKKMMIMILAATLGLILSIFMAFFLESLAKSRKLQA